MSAMGEFNGYTLAVGSVRGLRGWSVSSGGLRSVAQPYTWNAGANAAHCFKTLCDCAPCRAARDAVLSVQSHTMETCSCGFYAYFAEQGDTATASIYVRDTGNYLIGVVEGFGHTVIGSKGFRAEKARVLALCVRPADPHDDPDGWKARGLRAQNEVGAQIASQLGVPLLPGREALLAEFPTSTAAEFTEPEEVAS